jgi:cytochrome oxidase Cu insertion factor (SCO1/SenC/PrrC family)
MNAKLMGVVIIGLVMGTAAAIAVFPEARQRLLPSADQTVSGKALVGGPFSLTDSSGKRVTDTDFRGRDMLVFFGFTSCPDICPASLQLISAALDKLGPKADRIAPIFITIDPERDTAAKLAEYVKHFSPRIVGLTGTPEEIATAAKAYRVYYNKVPNKDAPGDYTMDHTGIIYLMDANGDYVTHFTPVTPVADMTAKLAKLL